MSEPRYTVAVRGLRWRGCRPYATHEDLTAHDAGELARIYRALGHRPEHIRVTVASTRRAA